MSNCLPCSAPPSNVSFKPGALGLTSDACPWVCSVGFYSLTVPSSALGPFACVSCANAPARALYTGAGSSTGVCPWQCQAGSYNSGSTCSLCKPGTFQPANGLMTLMSSYAFFEFLMNQCTMIGTHDFVCRKFAFIQVFVEKIRLYSYS